MQRFETLYFVVQPYLTLDIFSLIIQYEEETNKSFNYKEAISFFEDKTLNQRYYKAIYSYFSFIDHVDYNQSIELLNSCYNEAVQTNNYLILGLMHLNNIVVEVDFEKSKSYFIKALNEYPTISLVALLYIFIKHKELFYDDEYIEYVEELSENDNSYALLIHYFFYHNNIVVNYNKNKSNYYLNKLLQTENKMKYFIKYFTKRDSQIIEGLSDLNEGVDKKDVTGLFLMGGMYLSQGNNIMACECFKEASYKLSSKSILAYGQLVMNDDTLTDNDFEDIFKMFRALTILRNVEACYMLGVCYFYGFGVESDHDMAFKMYKLAYDLDYDLATCRLGEMYEEGIGVEKSLFEAFSYYGEAVHLEISDSYSKLAKFYHYGYLNNKDIYEAIRLYEKGVSNNDLESSYQLSTIYQSEEYFDEHKAIEYLSNCAEYNYKDSSFLLAKIYFKNEEYDLACDYFLLAYLNDSFESCFFLGYINYINKSYEEAYSYFQVCKEHNIDKGIYYLALCYQNGYGCKKDLEQSNLLLEELKLRGFSPKDMFN